MVTSFTSSLAEKFQILGALREAVPHGSGHINDTFAATFSVSGTRVRYIFQRINHRVFRDPQALMGNILRVTVEVRRHLINSGVSDYTRRGLTVVPALDGLPFVRDEEGSYWRCYLFIEGASTYDSIREPRTAYEAARAFGQFQRMLTELPGPRLNETIPDFHNTPARFRRLQEAVAADSCGRLAEVGAEWDFIRSREALVGVLSDLQAKGEIPERITHNDTKLNNVMIDDATGTGICVIDLDTVMPGLALHDFGDMVRSATSPAAEDEKDLSKVVMRLPVFEALLRGYLSGAGAFLNEAEKAHLVFSGKLITLEIGIRFLTDYLEGDTYFKTKRPGQNLDRCRSQLALVASIEAQEAAMEKLAREVAG
jgi:aminoglycoside phosphotransferase (APT) family kinase protein